MLDEQRVMWLIGGKGSGLPLPLAFSTVIEEIIDNDYADFEVLRKALENALAFKEDRVLASPFRTWAGFAEGIVGQLEAIGVIQELGGAYFTDKGFQSGVRTTAIPGTDVWFQVWTREDRERRDRAARMLIDVRGLLGEFSRFSRYPEGEEPLAAGKLKSAEKLIAEAERILSAASADRGTLDMNPVVPRGSYEGKLPRPTPRELAEQKYGLGGRPVAKPNTRVFGLDGKRLCSGCGHPRLPEDFEVYTDGKPASGWFLRGKCKNCMNKYKVDNTQKLKQQRQ